MLRWSIGFLIIALIAGALGITAVQGMAAQIAWILFVAFLILSAICLLFGRRVPPTV